jgi:IS4 transposase
MCLDAVLSRFVEQSPVTVMAQVVLDRALEPGWIDGLFEAHRQRQYRRELLFSTAVELMSLVSLGLQPSVHAAVQARKGLSVSLAALYDKINRMEPGLARALVAGSAKRLAPVLKEVRGKQEPFCPGYRVRVLDGSHLPASEKRLAALRALRSGPLPGQSLVVYDPDTGIVVDLVPCEDGYTQERALMPDLLGTAKPGELWIADRNFSTAGIFAGWHQQGAAFVVREHGITPNPTVLGKSHKRGRVETGVVYEQAVEIEAAGGDVIQLRRIELHLDQPTEDGTTVIRILSNLPASVNATTIARLYRRRWSIERMFQWLESVLQSEIRTLGYPRAALFAFSVAILAFNVLSTIRAAIESEHTIDPEDEKARLSLYYVAGEIRASYTGMTIAVPAEAWCGYQELSPKGLGVALLRLASYVDLGRFRTHPRGPKKPVRKRGPSGKARPHVSTARILAKRGAVRRP